MRAICGNARDAGVAGQRMDAPIQIVKLLKRAASLSALMSPWSPRAQDHQRGGEALDKGPAKVGLEFRIRIAGCGQAPGEPPAEPAA